MMAEVIFAIGAIVFAFYSFSKVLAASVVRESESTPESPSGLARRMANYDLERASEKKRPDESWFEFAWVRSWRSLSAYLRCKRRTTPGRIDLAVVAILAGGAAIGWLDVVDKGLDFAREVWEAEQSPAPEE